MVLLGHVARNVEAIAEDALLQAEPRLLVGNAGEPLAQILLAVLQPCSGDREVGPKRRITRKKTR